MASYGLLFPSSVPSKPLQSLFLKFTPSVEPWMSLGRPFNQRDFEVTRGYFEVIREHFEDSEAFESRPELRILFKLSPIKVTLSHFRLS